MIFDENVPKGEKMNEESKESVRKNRYKLQEMSDVITDSYKEIEERLDEEIFSMKKLLDSDMLNRKDFIFFQESMEQMQKMAYECEEDRERSMKIVNDAISDNEEIMQEIERREDEKEDVEIER